jgi:DNA-binding NarL/FixJ family response regulator
VPNGGNSRLHTLTRREHEVLRLMAEGRSNTGISETLHLSPKTVEAHVRSIFIKLALPPESEELQHRRVQAVLQYLRGFG